MRDRNRTWWTASSPRRHRINFGWPISPTFRRGAASRLWRSCSMSTVGASSVGQWHRIAYRVRARCAQYGDLSSQPNQRDPSFRSRYTVRVDRIQHSLQRNRRSPIDGVGWRLLRRCDVREFQRDSRVRATRQTSLQNTARSESCYLRLHPRLQ